MERTDFQSWLATIVESRMSGLAKGKCSICLYGNFETITTRFVYLGHLEDLADVSRESSKRGSVCLCDVQNVLDYDVGSGIYRKIKRLGLRVPIAHLNLYSENTPSAFPIFPVCLNCFPVIRELMNWRKTHPAPSSAHLIKSLTDLYRLLYWKFCQDGRRSHELCLKWPHMSFIHETAEDNIYDSPAVTARQEWKWLQAYSYQPIASLPNYILSRLKAIPERNEQNHKYDLPAGLILIEKPGSQSPLFRMPMEVLQEVASYLDAASVFALRRTCVRAARSLPLDQKFWFTQMMNGELFGFLFTFEAVDVLEEIHNKVMKRRMLPPRWDWKKLVRQLASYSSFHNGGELSDAHPGFRNRRRIWNVLETIERAEYTLPSLELSRNSHVVAS